MKFGFGHVPVDSYNNHIALVQLAEELEFDFAWMPDQTFYRDPYVILGIIAHNTKYINLGVGVTNPYTRHPAMNARAIATINDIAPGRIHFGVGAGNQKELINPLGFDGSHAATKIRDMVKIVQSLLDGETVEYSGDYFQAHGVRLNFSPHPRIPIYIAGRGPHVLRTAGEMADGAIIGGLCTSAGIAYALDHVRLGSAKSERDISQMEIVSWVTCHVTKDRETVMQNLRPTVAHIIGGAPSPVLEAVGLAPELVVDIKTVYSKEGIAQAAKLVDESCIEAFAIIGTANECIHRIRLLEQAGITQFSVLMSSGTIADYTERLRTFAETIFPAFR